MRCMYCNKELTDPTSVERGIGPICWDHMIEERQSRKKTTYPADKSDYEYYFRYCKDDSPILVITDLHLGGMSVTNNMEAILDKIATDVNVNIYFLTQCGLQVIYRDSEGNYDGVRIDDSGTVRFYPLTDRPVTSETEAISLARGAS